jgi:hypothetical protein
MNNSTMPRLCDITVMLSRRPANENAAGSSHGVTALSSDLAASEEQGEGTEDW